MVDIEIDDVNNLVVLPNKGIVIRFMANYILMCMCNPIN
jgi:hypothetical protein